MNALRRLAWGALPPVGLFVAMLVLWDAAVTLFDIKRFLLPRPRQVAAAAWEHRVLLTNAAWLTARAAICGFLASLAAGVAIGCAFAQSRIVQRSVYPYAVFLQTVPIVGIAPLIVFWFHYGFTSVAIVSFIISLFPVIAGATAGLTRVDRNLLDLFELNGANRWQILWKLRLPHSVPDLVTAAKTSSGLSVVGAIVGEMFAGAGTDEFGLGYLIPQMSGQLNTAGLFAAILASATLGLLIFGSVSLLGSALLARWHN